MWRTNPSIFGINTLNYKLFAQKQQQHLNYHFLIQKNIKDQYARNIGKEFLIHIKWYEGVPLVGIWLYKEKVSKDTNKFLLIKRKKGRKNKFYFEKYLLMNLWLLFIFIFLPHPSHNLISVIWEHVMSHRKM